MLRHFNILTILIYIVAHTLSDEVISARRYMYSSPFLRDFRKVMHDCNNYQAFSLDIATSSWIITLGVRKGTLMSHIDDLEQVRDYFIA